MQEGVPDEPGKRLLKDSTVVWVSPLEVRRAARAEPYAQTNARGDDVNDEMGRRGYCEEVRGGVRFPRQSRYSMGQCVGWKKRRT
jgi:hypothetical protein